MTNPKSYLTVSELQQLCEKLNLSSNGFKHELIERIQTFASSADLRVSTCHARIPLTTTSDQSTQTVFEPTVSPSDQCTQTVHESSLSQSFLSFNYWVPKLAMLFGFFGGCFSLLQMFFTETENIPVTRSWF